MKKDSIRNPASFRDPGGFVFSEGEKIFRYVNPKGREDYRLLMQSGLYRELVSRDWLVPHTEILKETDWGAEGSIVLEPKLIPFISYPYEWSFSQIKDAATLTLEIQLLALSYGMTLKDASAYNIQFLNGKPILIDTLSLVRYQANIPWVAYKQFCKHFVAPLALMSIKDVDFGLLYKSYLDGYPLRFTSKMLPMRSWLNLGLLMHIHLHSLLEMKYSKTKKSESVKEKKTVSVSKSKLIAIIESLKFLINKIHWQPKKTEWIDYYINNNHNYENSSLKSKRDTLEEFLREIKPAIVWDMGANTGYFSEVAAKLGSEVLSMDADVAAVEANYLKQRSTQAKNILPILMNIVNPSPDLGWANEERLSLANRGPVDCILALALIHHLVITNNIPFFKISDYFKACAKYLIIEFVPKNDSKTLELLENKVDFNEDYSVENFIKTFSNNFEIIKVKKIINSQRSLFLMKAKNII